MMHLAHQELYAAYAAALFLFADLANRCDWRACADGVPHEVASSHGRHDHTVVVMR